VDYPIFSQFYSHPFSILFPLHFGQSRRPAWVNVTGLRVTTAMIARVKTPVPGKYASEGRWTEALAMTEMIAPVPMLVPLASVSEGPSSTGRSATTEILAPVMMPASQVPA
jgi:hypothetical protein